MKKYETIWAGNAAIVQIVADLRANEEALNEALRKQNVSITGMAMDKSKFRTNLNETAIKIMGAIMAYATVVNELEVYQKFKKTRWELDRIRDTEFAALIEEIQAYTAGHMAELEPYGLTPALNDLFEQQKTDYTDHMAKPVEAKASRSEATRAIAALFIDMMVILKKRLDNAMKMFRDTESTFYFEYVESRKIIDNPSRPYSLKGMVTDAVSGFPVEKVMICIAVPELVKYSGKKGNYFFKGVKPGKYTVRFEKLGYETSEHRIIIREESTASLDVSLTPETT
ncbi:MAG: carboxypeptidase-like regulatory domain-containing protein [Bacteroidota bacterium]